MSENRIPDSVARHAGLVMTQAASIASVLEVGELICPFAVITKDEKRQSIEFEVTTQDEAVSKGWDSFSAERPGRYMVARKRRVATRDGRKRRRPGRVGMDSRYDGTRGIHTAVCSKGERRICVDWSDSHY